VDKLTLILCSTIRGLFFLLSTEIDQELLLDSIIMITHRMSFAMYLCISDPHITKKNGLYP
jgi:hypothetical protein